MRKEMNELENLMIFLQSLVIRTWRNMGSFQIACVEVMQKLLKHFTWEKKNCFG